MDHALAADDDVTPATPRDAWRRTLTVAVAAVGFLLAALATAWACTSQSHISSLEPSSAPAGTEVTVSGAEYAPGEEVEVRWQHDEGPVLAATTVDAEGTFTLSVTLPAEAAPGEHMVFAIAPDLYPTAGKGAAVVAVEDDEPAPQPAPATEEDPGRAPAAEEAPAPAEEPAPATAAEEQPAPAAEEPARQPAATDDGAPADEPATAPATSSEPAPLPPALERDHVAVTSSGAEELQPDAVEDAAPPRVAAEAPAWTGSADEVGQRPDVGLGIGVLAVGLVVVFGGFATAVLTGRRQRAEATHDRG